MTSDFYHPAMVGFTGAAAIQVLSLVQNQKTVFCELSIENRRAMLIGGPHVEGGCAGKKVFR